MICLGEAFFQECPGNDIDAVLLPGRFIRVCEGGEEAVMVQPRGKEAGGEQYSYAPQTQLGATRGGSDIFSPSFHAAIVHHSSLKNIFSMLIYDVID